MTFKLWPTRNTPSLTGPTGTPPGAPNGKPGGRMQWFTKGRISGYIAMTVVGVGVGLWAWSFKTEDDIALEESNNARTLGLAQFKRGNFGTAAELFMYSADRLFDCHSRNPVTGQYDVPQQSFARYDVKHGRLDCTYPETFSEQFILKRYLEAAFVAYVAEDFNNAVHYSQAVLPTLLDAHTRASDEATQQDIYENFIHAATFSALMNETEPVASVWMQYLRAAPNTGFHSFMGWFDDNMGDVAKAAPAPCNTCPVWDSLGALVPIEPGIKNGSIQMFPAYFLLPLPQAPGNACPPLPPHDPRRDLNKKHGTAI